jgi:hypothetical protein
MGSEALNQLLRLSFEVLVGDNIPRFGGGNRAMPKNWLEGFLRQQAKQRDDDERQRELDKLGEKATTSMFRKLKDQIENDVKRFNEARPERTIVLTVANDLRFRLSRPTFPVIGLEVWTETLGSIDYMSRVHAASSLKASENAGHILTIAKSNDEIYYRMDGEDLTDESEVSEKLLTPLLSAL